MNWNLKTDIPCIYIFFLILKTMSRSIDFFSFFATFSEKWKAVP